MQNKNKKLSKINLALKRVRSPMIRERLLMLKKHYQEQTFRAIAKHHQCSPGKVKYWEKRYEKYGLKGLQTKQKTGRPPKLNSAKDKQIKKEIIKQTSQQGGWETKQIKEYIKEETGVIYSSRHIVRIAQRWGLSRIIPRPQYAYAKKKDKENFLKGKH